MGNHEVKVVTVTPVLPHEFKTIFNPVLKPDIIPLITTQMGNENLKETLDDVVDILLLSKATFADGVQVQDVFALPKFITLGKDVQNELSKALEELKHLSPEAAIDSIQHLLNRIKALLPQS